MAEWKKVLVSGSNIEVNQITGSGDADIQGTLSIEGIADVSASIAAAGSAITAGDGLFKNGGTLSVDSGSLIIKADNTEIQSTITSNQTVGGIASGESFTPGTDVEDLLRQILVTYLPPSFSSFKMQDNSSDVLTSNREIGSSFDVDGLVATVVADDPDGNPPVSGSVVSTGANSNINVNLGDDPYTVGSNTETFTNSTIQRDTNGSVTFTLSGKDKDGSSITRTQSFNFRTYNVLAATSTDINSNATATTVYTTNDVDSELDTNRSWTATCTADNNNASNYTYIIYPAAYQDLSAITQNGSLPVLTAFTKQTDRTVTLSTGLTVLMRIYKSNATGAFASGTTLTIS